MDSIKKALDQIMEFRSQQEIVYATGRGSLGEFKKLSFTLEASYKIYVNKVLVRETTQPSGAVEFYNELGGDQLDGQ